MKKILHRIFLDQKINKLIIFSFLIMLIIQVYYMSSEWINYKSMRFFQFIESNHNVINILITLFPLIIHLLNSLKEKRTTSYINPPVNVQLKKNKMFPGLISQEMLMNENIILINKRHLYSEKERDNSILILDREKQCNNIKSHINSIPIYPNRLNCLFLTGTSGAGKSILLKQFLLKKLNDSTQYINSGYFDEEAIFNAIESKISCSEKNDCYIVIMDQFEDSLYNQVFFSKLKDFVNSVDVKILFIFSFPQNYFNMIHINLVNAFSKSSKYDPKLINESTYFLCNDEYDINELKILVKEFTKEDAESIDNYIELCKKEADLDRILKTTESNKVLIFFCSIIARVELGESPLVEFSLLSYIYEQLSEKVKLNLDQFIKKPSRLIDLYLNNWTENFYNPESAKLILYLLSDKKTYVTDDLKYVTFEPLIYFDEDQNNSYNVIQNLRKNTFLNVIENYSEKNKGFSTVHDYAANKIQEYCFNNLSNELRQNVDFYRNSFKESILKKYKTLNSKLKFKISERYDRFVNLKNMKLLEGFIIAILSVSIFFNIYNGRQASFNENLKYIFIIANTFFSTYYVYNFLTQFMRILRLKYYILVATVGLISVIICFILPFLWAISLGVEVLTLGLSLIAIKRSTVNPSSGVFKKMVLTFSFMGLVVIFLGIVDMLRSINIEIGFFNFIDNYVYYILFLFYSAMCVILHINYNYLITRIGMANAIKI